MPFRKDEEFLPHFLANTPKEAEELYKKYKVTLSLLAAKYASYTGLDTEDLIQEGVIGLARAVRDFEEDRSDTFHTFAIYKMKDAMREFSTKQADDIKIPQYIQEAARLVMKLRKIMESADLVRHTDYLSLWSHSATCEQESMVIKDITEVRRTIRNLADRSGTSVEQLLERAELYPSDIAELNVIPIDAERAASSEESSEEIMIRKLMTEKALNKVRSLISESEYQLLYAHYVEGKTVRELAPELGIKAASVTIRIHNILEILRQKKEQVFMP